MGRILIHLAFMEEQRMGKRMFAIAEQISGTRIRTLRKKLGLSQAEFGRLVSISAKTVARWETAQDMISGPIVTIAKLLEENPQIVMQLEVPVLKLPLRLWYMKENSVCTMIDVDERRRLVEIHNYTNDRMNRAFGADENPTFEAYESFLESRCFPRTRDKIKLELKRLNLPFYDPLMIIEKTGGRMAEDQFWIRMERKQSGH